MQTETTRRALLGGAGLAIEIVAAPVAASVTTSRQPVGVSPELIALIAEAEQAERRQADHDRTVCQPALARSNTAMAEAEAANPHFSIDAGPSMGGGRVIWSTDKPASVGVARAIVEMQRGGSDRTGAGSAAARKLYAAHLRRTRAIDRVRRAHDLSHLLDENEALCALVPPAQEAVASFGCRTIADLHAKLAFIVENEMGDGVDWTSELLADAARLSQKETL